MAELLRRFAGPAIGFLIGSGLQISGYTNPRLALILFAVAGGWFVVAILTWQPVRQIFRRGAMVRSTLHAERGLLDFLIDAEKLPNQMAPVLTEIAKETTAFGHKINAHTERIMKERVRNRPDFTRWLHKRAGAAAKDIRRHVRRLQKHLALLEHFGNLLADSCTGLAPTLRSRVTNEDELKSLQSSLQSFLLALDVSGNQLESYRSSVIGIRGATQDLNQASSDLVDVVDRILGVIARMRSACKVLVEGLL